LWVQFQWDTNEYLTTWPDHAMDLAQHGTIVQYGLQHMVAQQFVYAGVR
jgi:hypothetical protein